MPIPEPATSWTSLPTGAGISYLDAHLGTVVHFGGTTAASVNPATCYDCVGIFGYNGGSPLATLTLGAVPEPATWTLMIGGFGLVGVMTRRRQGALAA